MAYIGKQPVVGNFVKLDAITTSATATYNLLNGGVAYFPQTANNCIVSLNGVIQSPTSAYTISGSTIVFSDALTSSDTIDFILVLGDVLSIGTPSDGTITSAKLASGTDGLFAWQSVQTTGFTAVAARAYPCNTTSSAFTVTLPASPSVGDQVLLLDYAGTWDSNALTINPNSNKILGQTSNVVASKDREALTLTYIDSTQGWLPNSGYQESTNGIGIPYSVDFLVVAGGGGGAGAYYNGGGGAGGYRTSTQSVTAGTVITVTVGDGGAGGSSGNSGTVGSDSSISGSGLTTITSAGGGFGGKATIAGGNGGSGGGGGEDAAGGSGNTPSTSPSQGNNGGIGNTGTTGSGGGGGGGAGAVGSPATQNNGISNDGGNGGNGTASSITGSSVTYAGGGGGGAHNGTGGTGGTGGGGNGASTSTAPTAGTANLGGGGGGACGYTSVHFIGGNGGKGVVILSVPTANYSGTSTGSPTITTSGSNTILKFTGSGTYTG
jgi:hypothetical protein